MKRYFLIATGICLSTIAFAQNEVNAPNYVLETFSKAHPKATKVKWEREKENFEVNFTENKQDMSVLYSQNGVVLETEVPIAVAALPQAATEYVKAHYKTSIKDASKITRASGEVFYEADVKKVDVIFDADGKFVREEHD